ncbi:MAG: 1-acyl-sn-glycerol-3-phosphate acyltransferase [Alphaproteobacteria bacterium]|nr:1-acyl-sn-glycerol-3-phosphate acyltransferase [Alphaproteobacteria bacterium]
MRETVLWIRSILFVISWYVITLILFILFSPTLLFSCKAAGCFPRFWSKMTPKLLCLICGIQLDVQGLENLPQQNGYIIASKHQSAFETGLFHGLIPHVFYVLKKELLYIPIAGIYFLKTGCIPIDRGGGAKTMRKMLTGVKKHLDDGMNLVIFPEGTRTKPGTKKPYTPGVAFLYEQCKVPVVPVALNTGYCWPKNQIKKYAGKVTLRILPPIEAGLDKREFLNLLYNRIETAQDELPNPFKS